MECFEIKYADNMMFMCISSLALNAGDVLLVNYCVDLMDYVRFHMGVLVNLLNTSYCKS